MNWDDVFAYADETVDYLKSALAKAERILEVAREQQRADTRSWPVLTDEQKGGLRKDAKAIPDEISDAGVAADNLWDEVRGL